MTAPISRAAQLAPHQRLGRRYGRPGPLPQSSMFVTGDSRGNENVELTALQTTVSRNHNRIAAQLQSNPTWTDEQLFQEARKLNIAEYQSIIYNDYSAGPARCQSPFRPIPATIPTSTPRSPTSFDRRLPLRPQPAQRSALNGRARRPGPRRRRPARARFLRPDLLGAGQGQPTTVDPAHRADHHEHRRHPKGDADGDSQAADAEQSTKSAI